MAFQVKDFASITASMLNWMRAAQSRVTDFEVGGVARTMLEAPAAEIDELYQQVLHGIIEAIPVATYRSFQFNTAEARPAVGLIRVNITPITAATLIPAGTIFSRVAGGAIQYVSTADVTIAGLASFADVMVAASTAGSAGNVTPGTAFTAEPAILSFLSATAASGLAGGTDGETEAERLARFAQYIASLERATDAALEFAASLADIRNSAGLIIERVASAKIIAPYLSAPVLYTPGLVWVYIENQAGPVSAALLARCQDIIDGYTRDGVRYPGYKAAGVQVEVRAATRTPIAVTGAVTVAAGQNPATVRAAVTDAIFVYLAGLPIGAPAYRARIIALAMGVEGVANFTLAAPSGDTTPAQTEKLAPGAMTIT